MYKIIRKYTWDVLWQVCSTTRRASREITLVLWASAGYAVFEEEPVQSPIDIPVQAIQYIIRYRSECATPLLIAIQQRDFNAAKELIQCGLFSNIEGAVCLKKQTECCSTLHSPLLLLAEATADPSEDKEYWELLAKLAQNPRLNLGEEETLGGYPQDGARLLAHVLHYYPHDSEKAIYASDIVDALILRKVDMNRQIPSELLNRSMSWYKRPIQLALLWGSSGWEKCLEHHAEVRGLDCLSDMNVQYSANAIQNILIALQKHGLNFHQVSDVSDHLSQLDYFFLRVVQSDRDATFKQKVLELLYSLGARG